MNQYSDFKPVDRSRAYTWHGHQTSVEGGCSAPSKCAGVDIQTCVVDSGSSSAGQTAKKPWSRRNAWGSMSYADLIGKAIESTADKRMTLSQIYDWMIQNVPYFHDKGAGSSSTGWKNSIRHNLSLHRRFRRVPNEDSGKSSWWMLNDAADQCPPTRKRTVSVGKFDAKDSPIDSRPTPAKLPHVNTTEVVKSPTTSRAGENVINRPPWLQSAPLVVSSIASGAGGTVHVSELKQFNWHQSSTEADPFYVADLDPAFVATYATTSTTPLAPISELLPPQQFSSYDLQSVEIPSPPSYVVGVQSGSGDQSFSGHSLTALSSVTLLDGTSQPYNEVVRSSPVAECSVAGTEDGQGTAQLTPGWSMLRQMLSQSHLQNALMHGVITDDLHPHPAAAVNVDPSPNPASSPQYMSTADCQNVFCFVSSPQNVHASDVLLLPATKPSTTETQPASECQSVTVHTDLINTDKHVAADNNNDSVSVAPEETG